MARIIRCMTIVSTALLITVLTSACKAQFSQAPAETFTPPPQNLFATPVDGAIDMGTVQALTTGTAAAQLTTTPALNTPTTQPGVTPQVATATNTPIVVTNPTSTATQALASGPTATPIPAGSRPTEYRLQSGEFPYCIARRFNVDPVEMLQLSGLSDGVVYDPGTRLVIPQSGSFPGNRMLRTHPASYTVSQTGETVYSVACEFGDVDPALIASTNNISIGAALSVGQTLNIP